MRASAIIPGAEPILQHWQAHGNPGMDAEEASKRPVEITIDDGRWYLANANGECMRNGELNALDNAFIASGVPLADIAAQHAQAWQGYRAA